MPSTQFLSEIRGKKLPLLVEKDEDGFFVVECPVFKGCYTQGKTLKEAIANIKEVIKLILEEKETLDVLKSYRPKEISLRTLTL